MSSGSHERIRANAPSNTRIDAVVKVGGGLLRQPQHFQPVLDAIAEAARRRRLVVVPGGGPFADAVRVVDAAVGLTHDAAHWMAVLGMDQLAHLVVSRLKRGVVVHDEREIGAAIRASRVAVLAVSRWLEAADPLPHSWTVTGDSIAAWAAGQLGARRLVLVKPPGAVGADALDAHFERALPAGVTWTIVPADQPELLERALDDGSDA